MLLPDHDNQFVAVKKENLRIKLKNFNSVMIGQGNRYAIRGDRSHFGGDLSSRNSIRVGYKGGKDTEIQKFQNFFIGRIAAFRRSCRSHYSLFEE